MPTIETGARNGPRPSAASDPGGGGPRLGWVDTARGITMILVVFLHADVVMQNSGQVVLVAMLFNYALFPMRMPMFFLVSGLLAAALLRRRPAGEVLRRRVLHYAWLYALWLAILAAVHAWALRDLGPPGMQAYYNNVEGPVEALLVTWNNTWFLYALMLFFAAALLLRRLPPAAQAAVALALAVPGLFKIGAEIGLPVIDRFYHFPYFMLGILGAERLRDAAVPRLGRPWIFLPLAAACLVLAALAHQQRILRDPAVVAALSVLAMPVELGVSVWLARNAPRLAAPLRLVGRNTLAVYVLHTITLRVLMAHVPALGGPLLDLAWLAGLTLGAVALALALGKLLAPVPGLFGLPWAPRRRPPGSALDEKRRAAEAA
jgi:uncharacterized membrane protein YcfT